MSNPLTPEILAYVAGLFEKASFSIITSNKYRIGISIQLQIRNEKTIDFLLQYFPNLTISSKAKSTFTVMMVGGKAFVFNSLIRPYMVEKKEHSEIIEELRLETIRLFRDPKDWKIGHNKKAPEELLQKRIEASKNMIAINYKYNLQASTKSANSGRGKRIYSKRTSLFDGLL